MSAQFVISLLLNLPTIRLDFLLKHTDLLLCILLFQLFNENTIYLVGSILLLLIFPSMLFILLILNSLVIYLLDTSFYLKEGEAFREDTDLRMLVLFLMVFPAFCGLCFSYSSVLKITDFATIVLLNGLSMLFILILQHYELFSSSSLSQLYESDSS